jgi:hypothetical protein
VLKTKESPLTPLRIGVKAVVDGGVDSNLAGLGRLSVHPSQTGSKTKKTKRKPTRAKN